ncbi:MAG: adaptor protein MecA [Clostridia bacterium]|nr:adaptor protein MecA [Clostridia bacterium]
MELIQISENKLKIMLSETDMIKYALDGESADYSKDETRRAFRHMLSRVRQMSGFDTRGERIFVQMYPSKGGGCEVFVTKLGDRKGEYFEVDTLSRTDVKKQTGNAYGFNSLENMLAVCRYLYNCRSDCRHEGKAFRDDRGNYYLALPAGCDFAHGEEFSKQISPARLDAYIKEHGRCLIESGAVEILGQL